MRNTLARAFSALLVITLVFAAVSTDQYSQRMTAVKDAEAKKAVQDAQTQAAEVSEQGKIREEQEQILRRQLREQLKQQGTYTLTVLDGVKSLFNNKVDGYTVEIPAGMKADMQFSNIRAVLEGDTLKIEIYRQEINTAEGSGIAGYINYSNGFINNRIDHDKEREGKLTADGHRVSWLQWSREALKNVENDKCHYAVADVILPGDEVITFLFKSSRQFENQSYLDVVKSLKLTEKTAEPYVRKIPETEHQSWDRKTAGIYEQYFGKGARLHWGIFETDAPVNFTELKKIETKLGFTFPILLYYTGILENEETHPYLAAALKNAKKEGRILELTLQPVEQAPEKGNMVYDILDGKYDTYLKNYAREVADYGELILFRPGNEMNGDWCVYSSYHTSRDTDIFQEFYRYVHKIFQDAGADNVIWVWNPNGKSFPDFKWNDELCYYPGDEYVDVIGMTSYNTGTYYESEKWLEFDQMYDALYQKYIALYEKPLMITEFSSSSVGGSKEAWVANMFRNIGNYDRIKVAVWWDGCDWDAKGNVARSYFIDETEALVRIFRENLARYQ